MSNSLRNKKSVYNHPTSCIQTGTTVLMRVKVMVVPYTLRKLPLSPTPSTPCNITYTHGDMGRQAWGEI